MFVCHCRAVSDAAIRHHIASGVACPDELAMRCGAGLDCGSCRPLIADLFAEGGTGGTPVSAAQAGVGVRVEVG